MFGLDTSMFILLVACLIFVAAFEFVNGFHDTANAVATVIYTNSLKPVVAVIWSGICNFAGVFVGGIAVAMGIVNLLPIEALVDQSIGFSIAMIMAMIISAIIWNLATWYVGLPASSSHTLIGSIIGVGIAFSFMPENAQHVPVNWEKARDIGASLLVSPLFGFSVALFLLTILKKAIKNPELFSEPKKDSKPPLVMQILLIITCTLVSFFHGSNDGQKGVGLVMLILICIVPAHFALKNDISPAEIHSHLKKVNELVIKVDTARLKDKELEKFTKSRKGVEKSLAIMENKTSVGDISEKDRFAARKNIVSMGKNLEKLADAGVLSLTKDEQKELKKEIKACKAITDYAPFWVLGMISISLGIGTMIGWKRIVRTLGEKIGKTHMSYAQGFSAELVASITIALSTNFGWPVSTTHVLSSGIAGAMVSGKGLKNLQGKTIRNILLAWVLTLPVCMLLSAGLFFLFRLFVI